VNTGERIDEVKTGGKRLRAHIAEEIDHTNMPGGNDAGGPKKQKRDKRENEEDNGAGFHGGQSMRASNALSKAFKRGGLHPMPGGDFPLPLARN